MATSEPWRQYPYGAAATPVIAQVRRAASSIQRMPVCNSPHAKFVLTRKFRGVGEPSDVQPLRCGAYPTSAHPEERGWICFSRSCCSCGLWQELRRW